MRAIDKKAISVSKLFKNLIIFQIINYKSGQSEYYI